MNAGEPTLPQLRMTLDALDSLPPVALPTGYAMTTLRDAGVDAWIEALDATGQLGDWDADRAGDWLSGERHAIPEGTFIVTSDGRPAATCCTIPPTSTERRAELGWLSVSPEHQGRGLGRPGVPGGVTLRAADGVHGDIPQHGRLETARGQDLPGPGVQA